MKDRSLWEPARVRARLREEMRHGVDWGCFQSEVKDLMSAKKPDTLLTEQSTH